MDDLLLKYEEEGPACSGLGCLKRSSQDEGPFWANRGKKDPSYLQEPFYADEPYWVLMRREPKFTDEPFFMSRGKKESNLRMRDRREFVEDVDTPFFAARGKRMRSKN